MIRTTVLLLALAAAGANFPEATITNGTITAKLYLPDEDHGYYRGTRFDWSGQIYSLKYAGHEYFGQWFPKYDPKLHDSIMGPVEEFRTGESALGYSEAKPNELFVRIGVGSVRKPDEKEYQRFRTYDLINPGKWIIRPERDSIEFEQELHTSMGYSYVYRKTIRLIGKKPEMTIEHSLRNTGKKPIDTNVYDHNFFVIDGQPTGPEATVKFAFEPKAATPQGDKARIDDRGITYLRELKPGESVFSEITGFGDTRRDYNIRIENRKTGAGVHITGDRPLSKLVFWSIRTTLCPEPYIELHVAPGKTTKWKYDYQFYTVSAPAPPR